MKNIIFKLSILMFAAVLMIFAAASDADGYMTFDAAYDIYMTEEPLAEVPMTYEAWIRVPEGMDSGYFIANSNAIYFHGFCVQVNKKGQPVLRFTHKVPDGPDYPVYHTFTFTKAKVNSGEWTFLAITTDVAKQKVYCYINGVLAETQDFTYVPPLSPLPFVLGGDNEQGNCNYYRGHLRTAALFSDVRTAAEIKADMTSVDISDAKLLAHYDLTNATFGDDVIADTTGKYDVHRTEFWQDYIEPVTDYAYSFAVVGDLQKVSNLHTDYVPYAYDWILENINTKKIEYLLVPGDFTDQRPANDWEVPLAIEQFERFEGILPMVVAKGNHEPTSIYDKDMNFPALASDIGGKYGGTSMKNYYKTAKIGKTDYLFIAFDFGAKDEVLEWACDVVEKHPNHKVVIVTHSFIHNDGTITDAGDYSAPTVRSEKLNNGIDMWNEFVRKYENIVLVVCGHIETYRTLASKFVGDYGNVVTALLINPQGLDLLEPTGIVTMLYFNEDGNVMTTEFYSTVKKQYYLPEVCRTTIYVGERSGDANGDGKVNVGDALCAISSVLGRENYKNADVDGDGKISLADALGIMKTAVKGE